MSKKLLLLVVLVCWAQYSYSESITPYYGQTGNAAVDGLRWNMDNVFPDPPGLDVNAVIYSYTIQKQVQDHVDVYVQNENALGSGYIFREKDEWRPGSLSGTEINKAVPVIPNIPRAAWGDGSIDVDGNGSVTDATVVYSYKVDPCFDPQYDPNCPGYEVPMPELPEPIDTSTLYDAMDDENVSNAMKETDQEYEEEDEKDEDKEKEKEKKEKEDSKERLEKALAAADTSALFAEALASAQMLDAMNAAVNMTSYYSASIQGGVYKESVVLKDKQIPDNKRGLRNGLAQQILHEKMVDMQYK
jgi:hypothetical protein